MTSRSKIIGINRDQIADADDSSDIAEDISALDSQSEARPVQGGEEDAAEHNAHSPLGLSAGEPASGDHSNDHIEEEELDTEGFAEEASEDIYPDDYDYAEEASSGFNPLAWMGAALLVIAAAWTGFFVWSHLQVYQAVPANSEIARLIGYWALPFSLLGLIWLLLSRNSRTEALRFADVGTQLRNESEALESRMRTVNEEIALAREFLAQNAKDLESLGRQSSDRLGQAAEKLNSALADSDEKAKHLEEVSTAAANNLLQLRKHLPVVSSAAKDVANQIGSTGNTAQTQMDSLIATVQNMTGEGKAASEAISGLEKRAVEASDNIRQTLSDGAKSFASEISVVHEASDGVAMSLKKMAKDSVTTVNKASRKLKFSAEDAAENLDKKMSDIVSALDKATQQAQGAIGSTADDLNKMLDGYSQNLKAQLGEVASNLEHVQSNVALHDERFDVMIQRVSEQIGASREQLEELDVAATEKNSHLAFSIETLAQSTRDLDEMVAGSNAGAGELVANAERLGELLSKASSEVNAELPAKVAGLEEKIKASFTLLDRTRNASEDMDRQSASFLSRMENVDTVISQQRIALEKLLASSDEQLTSHHEQASALAESLQKTRDMVSNLTEQSGGELLTSIQQIRETTEEAVERSRSLIDQELSDVAGRLSKQNNQLLEEAVEHQLVNINARLEKTMGQQLSLSQSATDQLSKQLSDIDEMTSNLERRLQDTQSGFGGLDHEGFARRMGLLTESLNSTAIDVAKILSNEVTDTAWASYLKGDRGVFTRRAVRLLDNGEARAIAEHYESDPEFTEHVNRYIHDFEAMMRVLLSTRDGNAIGVTILSSDVGKLYVALAQAIERLRS